MCPQDKTSRVELKVITRVVQLKSEVEITTNTTVEEVESSDPSNLSDEGKVHSLLVTSILLTCLLNHLAMSLIS